MRNVIRQIRHGRVESSCTFWVLSMPGIVQLLCLNIGGGGEGTLGVIRSARSDMKRCVAWAPCEKAVLPTQNDASEKWMAA